MPASVSFTVVGTAIVLMTLGRPGRMAASVAGVLVTGIAMLSIIGYVFAADSLYSMPRLTTIALQTATILLALGIGLITMAEAEPIKRFWKDSAAATLVRRTLPFIVALPVVFGWLS